MKKTELLDHTAKLPAKNTEAIKLARSKLTDDQIEMRRVAAQCELRWVVFGLRVAAAAVFIALFIGGVNFLLNGEAVKILNIPSKVLLMYSVVLLMWLVTCCVMGGLLYNGIDEAAIDLPPARTAKLLTPVTGTELCKSGADAVTSGGPLPSKWRDIALQERNQLYGFDVAIMVTLAEAERLSVSVRAMEQANRAQAAELADACRVLHGLPKPEPANC